MGKDRLLMDAVMLDQLLLERDIKTDLQVILQILVINNITNKEEVDMLRKVVKASSPTILDLTKKINELQSEVNNGSEFYDLFYKSKNGSLTDEEREKMNKMLKEDPKKYGSLIYDAMKR